MLIKNEQSNFSEHVDPKFFLILLLIYTNSEKNKMISTDTLESIDKDNLQNFRED